MAQPRMLRSSREPLNKKLLLESNLNQTSVCLIKEVQRPLSQEEDSLWKTSLKVPYDLFALTPISICLFTWIVYTLHSRHPARGGRIKEQNTVSSLGLPAACSAKSRHGQDGLQGNALDHFIDISDLGELAGSWAFEQGVRAIIGARWVLNIRFFSPRYSFNFYLQTPDGNFASSGKMLFIVAYISYRNGEMGQTNAFLL